jgi:hypothetical protein
MTKHIFNNYISPTFTHEKLESPSYDDLVDVFEDRMRNWFFFPASKLLEIPNCEIAAVALLLNYFEGIEVYLTGKDSKRNSAKFFENCFRKVFDIRAPDPHISKRISSAIYSQARCGFAHDGMFRNRIFFSHERPEPILVTWPKKDGALDKSGDVESVVINPIQFFESIVTHFDRYIRKLRDGTDEQAMRAFEIAVRDKWRLDEPPRAIGMTEAEFLKK